ncbi:MAG: cupin domain-containing protein [Chloroflexi bacterium]|nr:cupin domain-containing protein [Chloroflexota bacterium]
MTTVLVLACLLAACGPAKGTATNPILPSGVSPTPLEQKQTTGIGRYTKIVETDPLAAPAGVTFVSFVHVTQPAGISLTHDGPDGLVYAVKGRHVVSREDGDHMRGADEGKTLFVSHGDVHRAAAAAQDWWFVGLGGIDLRGTQIVSGGALAYASGDLATLPPGVNVKEQLGLIEMAAGGRTSSHSHGGAEAFAVLTGSVELRTGDGARQKVASGGGGTIQPGVPMQIVVAGPEPVRILTFFATPEGRPWQTNLDTVP